MLRHPLLPQRRRTPLRGKQRRGKQQLWFAAAALCILLLCLTNLGSIGRSPGASSAATARAQSADLVLTGVIDGPLPQGRPKAVELYAIHDIADLSRYGFGVANNGDPASTQDYVFPAVAAAAGSHLYVSLEADAFAQFFGFPPTFTYISMNVNGDDVVQLFRDGAVIDRYGELGVDGTGQPWAYQDGWAYRRANTGPDGAAFTLDHWKVSGSNALDGETTNAGASAPFPARSYSFQQPTPQPVSSTLIVEKQVVQAEGSQNAPSGFLFDFALSGDRAQSFAQQAGERTTLTLDPGNYTLTESVDDPLVPGGGARWSPLGAACDGGQSPGALTLAGGETVTCTFVNEYDFQRLRLTGECPSGLFRVRNDNGYPVNYTWDIAGGGADGGGADGGAGGSGTAQPGDNAAAFDTGRLVATARLFVAGTQNDVKATRKNCNMLTVIKRATPADGTDFSFSTQSTPLRASENSPLPAAFTLDDAGGLASASPPGDDGDGFGRERRFGALFGGTYAVTELPPPGWVVESISCEGAAAQVEGARFRVTLDNSQAATCTVVNRQQPATLIVRKQLTTAADSAAPPAVMNFAFALTDDATVDETFVLGANASQTLTLPPGTYRLAETIVDAAGPRVSQSSATCDNESPVDSVRLPAGATVTCTFVNEYNFQPLVPAAQCPSGAFDVLNPNAYPVTFAWRIEGDAAAQSATQSATAQPGPNPALLASGQPTGTRQLLLDGAVFASMAPRADCSRLTIIKAARPADGTDFAFSGSGPLGPFTLDDDIDDGDDFANRLTFENLEPGDYAVAEMLPGGWVLTGVQCSDGRGEVQPDGVALALGVNDSATCTFRNVQSGTLILEKQTSTNGDATQFTFTGDGLDGAQTLADNGELIVDNLPPAGYTIREADAAPGYFLTEIACDDGASATPSTVDVAARTATFHIDPGETVRCVFTNSERGEINVVKSASPSVAAPGDLVTYTYRLVNGSGVPLSNLRAVDDRLGNVPLPATSLAAGASVTGTLSVRISEADLPGPITNTVFVSATSPTASPTTELSARDEAAVTLVSSPGLAVSKQAVETVDVGDSVRYTYRFTNTGNVLLHEVTAVDDMLGPLPAVETPLAPGESVELVLNYATSEADLPGPITNAVLVTGTPPVGQAVTAAATATVALNASPALIVEKIASAASARVGERVDYLYRLTNGGNVTLRNVAARDDALGPVALSTGMISTGTLAPGQSAEGALSLLVDEALLPGPITNTVVATGTPPVGEVVTGTAFALVDVLFAPGVVITKTASAPLVNAGETVTYTYRVQNTGDVTLANVEAVDNPLGTVPLGQTLLRPGDFTTGTLSLTVDEAQRGSVITNTVIVTGRPPVGPQVTARDGAKVAVRDVGLMLRKTVGVAGTAPVGKPQTSPCAASSAVDVQPGTAVAYCYTVENTGAFTLTVHSLVDDQLGELLRDVDYPLAPGARVSTVDLGLTITATLDVTTTNVATWTALVDEASLMDGAALGQDLSVQAVAEATVFVSADGEINRLPTALAETGEPRAPWVGDRRLYLPLVAQ